jgi:hypothetical protein
MEVVERVFRLREILERVFRLLPPRDLRAVVLVCRWWREVGEAPGLWAWVRLTVYGGNIGSMPRVLGWGRLQAVKKLEVIAGRSHSADQELLVGLLQAVARHPGLKFLSIKLSNLSQVTPDLVARAVTGLEEVLINDSDLTKQQLEAILTAIITEDSVLLRKLNIEYIKLSQVTADLLAGAVTRLE